MFLEGLITKIEAGSIAEELELVAGDKILQVNGKTPTDIIDLSFLLAEEEIELLVEHADGEREIIAFEKD
ncbi:MAG: PDZ domain-containing protein, partial [Selenomonadaceae bacterium]|nr:PDZ domain-containing protein [Selenomonadaceae bacterium]